MSAADDKRNAELAARARKAGLPEWMQDAAEAVPTDVVQSLVSDFRRGPAQPSSLAGEPAKQVKKPNWQDPIPLESPPGQRIIDAMVEADTRRQKADAVADAIRRSKQMKGE